MTAAIAAYAAVMLVAFLAAFIDACRVNRRLTRWEQLTSRGNNA